jgi:hypothetical protein
MLILLLHRAFVAPKPGYNPQHLGLVDLQTPPAQPSPTSERIPERRVLHVMMMHVNQLNEFDSRIKGNLHKIKATVLSNNFNG